jgi:putative heme-binding domain-containing protein
MSKRVVLVLCCAGVILLDLVLLAGAMAAEPHPSWIWAGDRQSSNQRVRLTRVFQTSSTATTAVVRFAPISAKLTIFLDGEVIATALPYDKIQTIEVEKRLLGGDHQIVVDATGIVGPSAFFLDLGLRFADGSGQSIVSDGAWQTDEGAAANDLGPIERGLNVPGTRRVGIDAVDNYEQWKQALGTNEGTDPASFVIAPGFEMRLVRSALPDEDSWVSMEFDPQGRIVIGKEKLGLLRMTLSSDGNEVEKAEVVEDSLLECRGLAFIGNDLYANANNSKGLYRLRKDGDRFAEPELLFASTGGAGHGRNDLAVGPDGKLYSIHGDAVDLPSDAVDYTSPLRDARQGKKTSEGHLLRIDPESGAVEVLAAGLRNPFGIDFNSDGEVFTYDADAEYDMGSPWYRPTRVNHLVTGGDYGWRGVTKSWPPYYPDHPDNSRPNLDIGKGSPTAVKFGTRSNFPDPYRDALYILDWAYGRIIAVHMVSRGSSYVMSSETFLKGRPLNVTDMDFAPDGSMYLVTGGRQTQSGLYRVRYVGDRTASPARSIQQARQRFAANSRALRHQLEAELGQPPSEKRVSRIWTHLSDPDPWIQQAAINVIEHHPIELWQRRSFSETEITPALLTLTALARSDRRDHHSAIVRRLNELMPNIVSPADKLLAFYSYWLCLQSVEQIDGDLRTATLEALGAQYPSGSYSHNRLLSELLVKLAADDVVPKTIRLLNAATNQTQQMHYLYVLRSVRKGWSIEDRRAYFSGFARSQHYLGGAGMSDFLKKIRDEAIATLDDSERKQLAAEIENKPQIEETAQQAPRPLVGQWSVDELMQTDPNQRRGDQERGSEIFASASCIKCHRFGARGTLIGPDLTAASRRFNRRDLLVSMIEPSKVIAENYRSLQIVTTAGRAHVGQATLGGDYRSPTLHLATDPTQPFKTIEIPKTEIESQKTSEVSWMPAGLLDTSTKDEIADLVAYLQSTP